MTKSQHAQQQDPATEAAEWNSAIFDFIIHTCAFHNVTANLGQCHFIVLIVDTF